MTGQPVALVTGGGGGIGAAVSLALAAAGAHVLVAGRDQGRCGAVADRARAAGAAADPIVLDVIDPASIAAAVERARSLAGPVDWLVAAAGIAISAPIAGPGWEALCRRHMDVDFHGARRVFEALLPEMRERGGGRAVMVASSAALRGYAYVAAYAAAKHALLGYARSAALELARAGVGVHVLCPHYVDSPMLEGAAARLVQRTGRTLEEARAFFAAENPDGVLVSPGDVAEAALELLRDDRTGVVVELTGAARRELEPGLALGNPV